jgi:cystathionine beta-lyase/cystathionine gamma-synthase
MFLSQPKNRTKLAFLDQSRNITELTFLGQPRNIRLIFLGQPMNITDEHKDLKKITRHVLHKLGKAI